MKPRITYFLLLASLLLPGTAVSQTLRVTVEGQILDGLT